MNSIKEKSAPGNPSDLSVDNSYLPLVSIILVCRNSAKTIRRSLESVLSLDYSNIEYVVQDGASTDGTLDILREYELKFGPVMKLVSEPDTCGADGFHRALDRCSGTIIGSCLSDEELMPHAVSHVVSKFLEHPDVGVIHGDIYNTDLSGNILAENPANDFDLAGYLSHAVSMHFAASFFLAGALKKAGLFNHDWFDDFDFWCRLSLHTKMFHTPVILSKYAIHDDQISGHPEKLVKSIPARARFIEHFLSNEKTPPAVRMKRKDFLISFNSWASQCLSSKNLFDEAQKYADEVKRLSALLPQPEFGVSKILLISLPGLCTGDEPLFPLGIGYLLAAVRQDRPAQAVHYQLYDHAVQQLPEIISIFQPEIVGLTCTTFNRGNVRKTCEWLRKHHPDKKIILGGVHVSFLPEQALRDYGADYVVIGEGEQTLRELCDALDGRTPLSNVKGIAYLDDGNLIVTPPRELLKNLDELPLPDFSFAEHLMKQSGMGFVISSRGCPVRCSFCSTGTFWGQRVRVNSPKRVVDEIQSLINNFGVKKIFFHDDTFNLNQARVKEICEEITARKLAIEWGVSCRVHPVSQDMIDTMVAAGCRHICWGIESGSAEMLQRIEKKITLEQIRIAFALCEKHLGKISVGAFMMVGNQGESADTIAESISFINTLRLTDSPSTSKLYVLPGTKLYAELLTLHTGLDRFWSESDDIVYYTLEHPLGQLQQWSEMISRSGDVIPFNHDNHFWNNLLFGNIPRATLPQISFLQSELNNIIPPEIKDDEFYFIIQKLAAESKVQTVLEIGSSAGAGSTEAFFKGLQKNPHHPHLFCMEVSKPRFKELQQRYVSESFVHCYNVSSVPVSSFPSEQELELFYRQIPSALNDYPLERVIGWLRQDIEYVTNSGVPQDGIQKIKRETGIEFFDMVLIDGSEFTGMAELEEVYGAEYILLDDLNGFKNRNNYQRLNEDPSYRLLHENWAVRNGYAVFKKEQLELPVHFFTIVLNGEPFIKYHIDVFKKLPFKWHWHIVEGVADLKHDTAWSIANGGRITDELHRNGLSNDGTTEYLDVLALNYPENVTIYRMPMNHFWDGKLEMVTAPLAKISEECLLWQVDADELWTGEQISYMRDLFHELPEKTSAFFHCYYFVGPRKYVSSLDTWATYPTDWIRVWRFRPGMAWAAHEPPVLVDLKGENVGLKNPFTRDETKKRKITFQHFAYATEKQVRFKEIYYGYVDAIKHWQKLQQTSGPVNPADFLPWAKNDAIVSDWPVSDLLLFEEVIPHQGHPKKYSSMSVDGETQFETELRRLFQKIRPESIIETGTYLGQGTSSIIWRALLDFGIDADFTTIEVNPTHHQQATQHFKAQNMRIRAELGLSIPRTMLPDKEEITEKFIRQKENEDIYYDHDEVNRSQLYYAETDFDVPDNILYMAMERCRFKPDFVLLDSAGHVGFAEFEYFMSLVKGGCYLMLDDIYHCKHYKTLQAIKADPRFELLIESHEKFGFCIARYTPVTSLLFIRTDSIGDNILASSMLPYLREKYNEAKITVVCQEHISELYEASPCVDEIITFNKNRALHDDNYISSLRQLMEQTGADLTLNSVYSREPLNDFLSISSNAKKRIAFYGNLSNITEEIRDNNNRGYTRLINSSHNNIHELQRHQEFLRGIEINTPPLNPVIWTTKADEDFAEDYFTKNKLRPEKTIALFPCAQWEIKIFERYGEALADIFQQNGFAVIGLGAKADVDIIQKQLDQLGVTAINLAGTTTLRQTAALLRRCRLAVGADSALAHIACATMTPNVVVVGGGHFCRFFPYSPLTSVVCLPLSCYECNWKCQYATAHCIKDISPDLLAVAVVQSLNYSSQKARIFAQGNRPWPIDDGGPSWRQVSDFFDNASVDIIICDNASQLKKSDSQFPVYSQEMQARAYTAPYREIPLGLTARQSIATPITLPQKSNIFPESRLAHQWLDGMNGLEIGPSVHNPFGLNTRNVGLRFEGYEQEQKNLSGEFAPLHIVAPADDIPIPDDSEDFVLSSHVIEHCPDMIKTLVEWYRIVRTGGYLFMIVPFRDAAPTDKGRPLTEWSHVIDDYCNGANSENEPEANGIPFGYCHYHVFDIYSLHCFVRRIFGNRLELVDYQERDDKIGNGFTLVYRKTIPFAESFPWSISDKSRHAEIHRSGMAIASTGSPDAIVIAANLVPFEDQGQRQRQEACISSINLLATTEIVPLNICYPDELLQPTGWQTAPVLRKSANTELKARGKRKPFVTDLFDIASSWAATRGIKWFVLTNSDIILTETLIDEVRRFLALGYETIAVSRNEVARVDPVHGLIPGYLEVNGYDVFVCKTDWWQENRGLFHSYIYGERAWDDAYAAIMACHSRFAMLYKDGLCFHIKHPTEWLCGPYADYNMGIYKGIDKPYSDKYEAFIKEVINTDRQRLTPDNLENLMNKYFAPERKAATMQDTQLRSGRFVNICIITYNRLEFTRQCIDSLVRNTDYPHVITVIDNASGDGTEEYLNNLHAKGIIHNLILLKENVGVAKASNLAWSLEPLADYYLKLDNDIVMQKKGWLGEMISVIEAFPQIGALGYNFETVSYQAQTIGGFTVRVKEQGNLGGACILIPKRTEKLLGFWCEDYGLYGEEDADYGHRIIMAGLLNVYMADENAGFHLPAGKAAAIENATWRATDGVEEKDHAAYREWKDDLRRKNIENGVLLKNLNRYSTGPASLYQTSAFVEEWRQNRKTRVENLLPQETDITSPPALPRLKVLVFSLDLPESACARLRLLVPLRDRVEIVWAVSYETVNLATLLEDADLIVIQRGFPCRKTEAYLNQILASGKPVIYETDDLLMNLPEGNPHKKWADELAPFILDLLPKVAAVTVSTDAIREILLPYNKRIEVLPNMLDERLWAPVENNSGGHIVIGFTGTPTHQADLMVVEEALCHISGKYGGSLSFVFMGCVTDRLNSLPGVWVVDFVRDYASYADTRRKLQIDIAIVPLEDNRFNRCKSNIKWLEYSACGIAGIYSDLPPYSTVKNGETGLLVQNTFEAWCAALEYLIVNPEKRELIARKAQEEVLANYTYANGASLYAATYARIVGEHRSAIRDNVQNTGYISSTPYVNIGMVTYNRLDFTRQAIDALVRFTDYPYVLTVVDNNSQDSTREYLQKLHSLGIIKNLVLLDENIGVAKASNLAWHLEPEAPYYLKLDNDIVIGKSGWLGPLVEAIENIKDLGAISYNFEPRTYPLNDINGTRVRIKSSGNLGGACILIPRRTSDQIGYWCEDYGLYSEEDYDYGRRISLSGLFNAYMEDEQIGIHLPAGRAALIDPKTLVAKDGVEELVHGEYRHWKDAQRKENVEKGIVNQNIAAYTNDPTRLYVRSRFAEEWLKTQNARTTAKKVSFSIIIMTWNRAAMLDKCLTALFAGLTNRDNCQIIVGNNGSTDSTEEVLSRYRIDRYVKKTEKTGLEFYRELFDLAEGEYIIELDDDVLDLPKHFDTVFEEYFRSFPDYGFLGLDVVQNRYTNGAKPEPSQYVEDIRTQMTVQEGEVIGCCACIKKETFDQIGRFDGVILSMARVEDGVLTERVRNLGLRTGIIKDVKCFHANGPYYSKAYGYIDRDIEKYTMAGLNSFMESYRDIKDEKKTAPTVSIIIPLFNKVEFTRQCLEGVARSTISPIDFELILVDNASTDGTSEFLRTLSGDVNVITNPTNLGFARACNQGAKLATKDFLVFLNNDTIPKEGWLEALVDGIERDGADICGARLLYPNGKVQHAGVAFNEQGIGYHIFNGFDANSQAVTRKRFMQCVTAACMIMRRELFQTLSGFDEGYVNGFEDVDLCLRAGELGKRILYVPDCTLTHFEETSEGRKAHDQANAQRYFARWKGKVRCDDNDYYQLEGFRKELQMDGRINLFKVDIKEEKKMAPTVSIIIPLFNKVEYTRECLEGVATSSSPIDFELILVDNASTDGTSEFLRTLSGDVTIITNLTNLGFARACNQGAKLATKDFLVFLNNDTIPHQGWLEALVEGIERDGADICGARLIYPNGTIQHAGIAFNEQGMCYKIFNGFDANAQAVTRKRFMQCVTAACMIMRRELFHTLSGFDEGYVNGYEGVDLCLRASELGKKILYVPESTLTHFEQTSEGRTTHDAANARRYLTRWKGKVRCDDNDYYHLEGFRKELLPDGRIRLLVMNTEQPASQKKEVPEAEPVRQNRIAPSSCRILTEKGISLKLEGRYTEALEVFSSARNQGDTTVLAHMGDCLASLGKAGEAEAAYLEALRIKKDDPLAHIGIGVVKLLAQQFSAAAIAFGKALKSDPASSKALCGLGMSRYGQGHKNASYNYFLKALDADPENILALHELIRTAYDLGEFGHAVTHTRKYLMYHPADLDILFSFASILYKTGAYEEGCDVMERLLALSPEYHGGKELLERISTASANKAPLKAASEVDTSSGDFLEFFIEQGRINKAAGKYSEAFECFSKAREHGDLSVLSEMGDCMANIGDMKGARSFYEEGLLNNADDAHSLVGLGVLCLIEENLTEAGVYFGKALKADKENPKALCGLAMLKNLEGRASDAHDLFMQALDRDPENLTALGELVRCAYQLKRFTEAERHLENYLRYHPADLDMLFSQAGIQFRAGKYAVALDNIEKLLIFAPAYEGGQELKEKIEAMSGLNQAPVYQYQVAG